MGIKSCSPLVSAPTWFDEVGQRIVGPTAPAVGERLARWPRRSGWFSPIAASGGPRGESLSREKMSRARHDGDGVSALDAASAARDPRMLAVSQHGEARNAADR